MVNNKLQKCGGTPAWSDMSTIPSLSWRGWGRSRKSSAITVSVQVEIQTGTSGIQVENITVSANFLDAATKQYASRNVVILSFRNVSEAGRRVLLLGCSVVCLGRGVLKIPLMINVVLQFAWGLILKILWHIDPFLGKTRNTSAQQ
jgi:hypothetical protein